MPDDATPVPDPMAAPAPSPPPRRRWRKVLLVLGIGIPVLLGIGAACLPAILSSAAVRSAVEEKVTAASGRRLSMASLDVGWSNAEIRDLEVRWGAAADSPILARVPSIRVPAGISAAFASRPDVDAIEVRGPEIRVDLRELAKPAATPRSSPAEGGEAAPVAPAADAPPDPIPPFAVKVKVREGTLILVALDGSETRLGNFTADVAASSDGPATVEFALDAGSGGTFRAKVVASPFAGGKPVAAAALEATAEAAWAAFDLAPLRGAAGLAAPDALSELRGILDGSLSARLAAGAVEDGKVAVALKGLRVSGPLLGPGVAVEEPEVRLSGNFRRGADGSLGLADGLLAMEGVDAKAAVSLPAGGSPTASLHATVSLRPCGERAKRAGLPLKGWLLGQGELEVGISSGDGAERVTGSLALRDVEVAFGPGRKPVNEPSARATLDAFRKGGAWTVSQATWKSGIAEATVRGTVREDLTAADIAAKATIRIGPAVAVAGAFGAEVPGTFSGDAVFDAVFRRGAGTADEARGTLVITDLAVRPPGEGAKEIREARLEAAFDAAPGKETIVLRSATLKGIGAEVRLAGSCAADGATGSLGTMDADLDLGKLAALAAAHGTPLPVGLEGTAAWKGTLAWRGTFAEADVKGTLAVKDLAATLPATGTEPARVLREAAASATVDATVSLPPEGARVALREALLGADGLEARASGSAAADGAADLSVAGSLSLAPAARRAAALGLLPKDPAPAGSVGFDLSLRGKPGSYAAEIRKCAAEGAPFGFSASGTVSQDGAGDLRVIAGGDLPGLAGLAAAAGFLAEAPAGVAGTATLVAGVKAAGPEDALHVTLEAALADLRWPDPAGAAPWTQKALRVAGSADLDRKSLALKGTARLASDDGTIDLAGSAALAAGARRFDGTATLDFDAGGFLRSRPELLPLPDMRVGKVKGTAALGGAIAEPFDPALLSGSARLVLDEVATEPLVLKEATLEAVLAGGVLKLPAIAATVNEGKVAGSASLGLAGAAPAHVLDVKGEGIRIDGPMNYILKRVVPVFAVGPKGSVSGSLACSLHLEGSGADWAAAEKTLAGKGSLTVSDGAVTGGGWIAEALEFLGGTKGLSFASVTTEFAIHDRKVWNELLLVNGTEHAMVFRGSTSFDGDLDYRVGAKALKLGKRKLERIGPLLDADGNLPLTLGGTLAKPKLKGPDLKKILGNAAEDVLKKKLKELLGGDE